MVFGSLTASFEFYLLCFCANLILFPYSVVPRFPFYFGGHSALCLVSGLTSSLVIMLVLSSLFPIVSLSRLVFIVSVFLLFFVWFSLLLCGFLAESQPPNVHKHLHSSMETIVFDGWGLFFTRIMHPATKQQWFMNGLRRTTSNTRLQISLIRSK